MSLARNALRLLLPALLAGSAAVPCAAAERAHPSLYFGSRDVAVLRARFERPPFDAKWKRLLANADAFLAAPVGSGPVANAIVRSRNALGIAGTTAFAYALTGDRRYGERARQEAWALLDSGPWQKAGPACQGAQLTTGEACTACALVYDWCYDLFPADERARYADKLLEMGIRPYLASIEKHADWWVNNTVSNWAGVCHGGCGLAGLALAAEVPEARRAAEYAARHVPVFLRDVHRVDGGADEGVMYYTYGATFGYAFATAAARASGTDQGLGEDAARKLAGYWSVYLQGPDGRFANFNDMNEETMAGLCSDNPGKFPEGGPSSSLSALFEASVPGGDPLLLWAADHGGDAYYWRGASPFALLWRRDAPASGPKPPLEPAALFRESGQAVLQSPSLWFAFNGGWTSTKSHYNQDLGSFVLVAGGERFVNDPGYGRAATAEHSTILLGGDGQPAGARGVFRQVGSGRGFHYLACDLSRCYDSTLRHFVRHAVMVNGAYLVLMDDLAVAGDAGAFEWRLQTSGTIETVPAERRAVIKHKNQLHVVSVAPADARLATGKQTLDGLRITPGTGRAQETFVTVLLPSAAGGPPPKTAFRTEGGRGTLTVETAGGNRDTIVFSRNVDGWQLASVNGQDATRIPSGQERSVAATRPPAREGTRAALPVIGAPDPFATVLAPGPGMPVTAPPAPAPATPPPAIPASTGRPAPIASSAPAARPDPAPAAPASAAPVSIPPDVLETWRERLRERIRAGTRAGEKPTVTLGLTGEVQIAQADDMGLTTILPGSASASVYWRQLKAPDYLALARAFTKEGNAADHARFGFFLMAEGFPKAAEDQFARVLGADPKKGPAMVGEVRAACAGK